MEADIHINASRDGMVTCGKCEIKPLITEALPQKIRKPNPFCGKINPSRTHLIAGWLRYLFRNNERVTNPKC